MVTQKDVANLAGVSFITVSRVINGEQNVKDETRRKVLAAIDKLGYAPSFAGQVLNSGKCNTIGILSPIPFYKAIRSFYLMDILAGINDVCLKNGVDMLMNIVPEVGKVPDYDYLRAYKQKKVDGLIYIGLKKLPEEMLAELKIRKLPCVVIGDRPDSELISWVDTDNIQAAKNSVNEIWKRGHRRIAFVGLKKSIYNANVNDREKGFVEELLRLGVDYNPKDYIIRTDFDSKDLYKDVENALNAFEKKPTAIFCCTDSCVPGTVKGIQNTGLSVPDDISLVGFDGFINDTYFAMNVATNPQPVQQMGQRAAEILFNHIKNPGAQKETAVMSVPFAPGDSLKEITES